MPDQSTSSSRRVWAASTLSMSTRARSVEAPYTELERALPSEPVLNSDETGSRTNGEKRWER